MSPTLSLQELEIFNSDCLQLQMNLNLMKDHESRSWNILLNAARNVSVASGVSESSSSHTSTSSTVPQELEEDASGDDASSLFLSCENESILPPHLMQEISKLRDARNKLWNALHENRAVIQEFESLSLSSS